MMNSTRHVGTSFHVFHSRENLVKEGAQVNRRILDLESDPAIFNNETANRAFATTYSDVRDYLRRVMFDSKGEVVWTMASQLERAGYYVYRAGNGIDLHVGQYRLNVPAHTEHDYMTTADLAMLAAMSTLIGDLNVRAA